MTGFYTGFHISCFVLFCNETENESNPNYESTYGYGIYQRCCSSSCNHSHLRHRFIITSFGIHGLCERPSPELVALELWVKSKADGLESKWTVTVRQSMGV